MHKKQLIVGIGFAVLSVILGAFGAHGLEKHIESGLMTAKQLNSWETAARYQMYHAFAIIAIGLYSLVAGDSKWIRFSFLFFVTGIVFFSVSLYLISTRDVIGLTNWKWLGPVTPLGGISFMLGWICFGWAVLKKKSS
jgi:uncharacterized membrane protein YgdD (TMEM256/DUF423 family)